MSDASFFHLHVTMLFTLALLSFSSVIIADKLVFVQTLWRHGDRIPKQTYPTDPYQQDFWGQPWGEINQEGIHHQFQQGLNLRKMYIDSQFLNSSYLSEDVYFRSTDSGICLRSALSNIAGMYSDYPTLPADPKWPTGWMPIPVFSLPKKEDRVLQPGENCPRADDLKKKRQKEQAFQDFLASNWNLFALLSTNGGQEVKVKFSELTDWYDTLKVEKEQYNLELPYWITDDVYNQLKQAVENGSDYTCGAAGFGQKEDSELIKLRGGFLLHEWRTNLETASTTGGIKYHAYSAKDHTVIALLLALQAKKGVLGDANPDYASVVVNELWSDKDGFYVKFYYIDNATSPAREITSLIGACKGYEKRCPMDVFNDKSDKYSTKKDSACDSV